MQEKESLKHYLIEENKENFVTEKGNKGHYLVKKGKRRLIQQVVCDTIEVSSYDVFVNYPY